MQPTRSSENKYLVPEAWIEMIHSRVLTPYVKPDQVVVDQETIKQFETLDVRARAHATARGEHDALMYLSIYAIWNGSLWRCRYDSWEDYCDEWDKMPFGISKSSIKHKVADIKKLLKLGVTPDTIVKALGNVPMATRSLLAEVFDEHSDRPDGYKKEVFDKLPYGLDIDRHLQELADLGPIQAQLAVDELANKHNIYVEDNIEYDELTKRLFFRVTSRNPHTGILTEELHIPNVPPWTAKFLTKRLLKRG